MLELLKKSEAVAVLCLLTVNANDEIKLEELSSMLGNPFFIEHVTDKIGPHPRFLQEFSKTKAQLGETGMEKKAIAALKSAFPAFQVKTLALMTHIATADDEYDQSEKTLIARVAKELGVPIEDINPEVEKMQEAIINKPEASQKNKAKNSKEKTEEEVKETKTEEIIEEEKTEKQTNEKPAKK